MFLINRKPTVGKWTFLWILQRSIERGSGWIEWNFGIFQTIAIPEPGAWFMRGKHYRGFWIRTAFRTPRQWWIDRVQLPRTLAKVRREMEIIRAQAGLQNDHPPRNPSHLLTVPEYRTIANTLIERGARQVAPHPARIGDLVDGFPIVATCWQWDPDRGSVPMVQLFGHHEWKPYNGSEPNPFRELGRRVAKERQDRVIAAILDPKAIERAEY